MSEEDKKQIHELWTNTCEMLEKQFADMSLMAHQATRVPYEGIAAVLLRGAVACYTRAFHDEKNPKEAVRNRIVEDANIILSGEAVDHMVEGLRKQ